MTFPLKNLELREYLAGGESAPSASSSVSELRAVVARGTAEERREAETEVDRAALQSLAQRVHERAAAGTKYDLLASICHDSAGGSSIAEVTSATDDKRRAKTALERGSFRIHLQNRSTGQWFEMQDLHVTETLPQLIGLAEASVLVYERKEV